jgi:hypothetical protein
MATGQGCNADKLTGPSNATNFSEIGIVVDNHCSRGLLFSSVKDVWVLGLDNDKQQRDEQRVDTDWKFRQDA